MTEQNTNEGHTQEQSIDELLRQLAVAQIQIHFQFQQRAPILINGFHQLMD